MQKDNLNQPVLVSKSLLEGGGLFQAYYFQNVEIPWRLTCQGDDGNTEFATVTMEKALSLFPEIGELINLKMERSVMFQKGKNSGKWYDFIL